jgi:reductive dehalogenase
LSKEEKQNRQNDTTRIVNRRDFLKLGTAVAATSALATAKAPGKAAAEVAEKVREGAIQKDKEFSFELRSDYKRFNQRNIIQGGGAFEEHPELFPRMLDFANYAWDDAKPGHTQLDYAFRVGAFSHKFKMLQEKKKHDQYRLDDRFIPDIPQRTKIKQKPPSDDVKHLPKKLPSSFLDLLCGNFVNETRYQFKSKLDAATAIKRAGKFYGADLVGITRRDKRFDYDPLWDHVTHRTFGWDKIPFTPKTVIVMAFEMDYDAFEAGPSDICAAAVGEGYSKILKTTYQLSIFLKNLGYMALYAENDLGISIPYAVLAGLGEQARNGLLITHQYGPRVRIGKVYTDFDFVEYDSPINLGVTHFCQSCLKCADACPTKAIMRDPEPTFEPTFKEGKKDDWWYLNPGAKKFYNDTLKCFDAWVKTGGCGACITSCPFNKPDFWHHRIVHSINALLPGPMHDFMREMDDVFGYGNTYDEKAAKRFWQS